MRLAIRFETATSSTLVEARLAPSTTTRKRGPISVPRFFPLSRTRALWWTSPRSSAYAAAWVFGRGKAIVYVAVPEKDLTASPSNAVQDVRVEVFTSRGRSGPPSANRTDHVPWMAAGGPSFQYG